MSDENAAGWRHQLALFVRQQALPAHKIGHQFRLYALTKTLGSSPAGQVYDDDVVFAAAMLHDLGVFVGHRPEDPHLLAAWDHVQYTCQRAPDLLQGFGFPDDKIGAVLATIREHQPRDTPSSPEATMLRDADILEQLGAIGILRVASKVGSDTRFLLFKDARQALAACLRELPGQLRLPQARELAEPRIAVLQHFLISLEHEAGEELG